MFKFRRGAATALLATMALVAGCGTAGKNTEKPATETKTETQAPVKITFWHGMDYNSTHGKTIQAMVREWNATNPGIQVEEVYQGSYTQLEQKVTAAIAAQTPPTVVQNTDSMLTNLVKVKAVQDLTSRVPAADKSDYPPSLLEAQTIDGRLYALPFNKSMIVLIYNKKLVATPPRTWDEFRKVSREVTQPGKVYGTAFNADVYYFGTHFAQAGGKWIDGGKAAFAGPEGVQAMQLIVDMSKEGSAIQLKPNEYQSNYFNEGRAAMIATTSASFAFIEPVNGDPWGVAPLYAGPKNDSVPLSGANLSLVSGIKPAEAEAGLKFMLYMTGKEGTLKWATAKTGYMPVRKSAVETPQWKEFVKANPIYEVLGASINKGTVQPNLPGWNNAQKALTTAVEKAVLGQTTPAAALEEAAKAADEVLARAAR